MASKHLASNIDDKWDGTLEMSFRKQAGDIFYYDVIIDFKGKKVSISLPRYAPMIGWIEVFGLPPQNEWVVLDPSPSLSRRGLLTITSGKRRTALNESLDIHTDSAGKWRLITLLRSSGKKVERMTCVESWDQFDDLGHISKRTLFEHSKGTYSVTLTCTKNPKTPNLTTAEQLFLKSVTSKRGRPTEIWHKAFTASGNPPPLYSALFPFWNDVWRDVSGSAIEIGYEKEMGHGDWHKLFTLGTRQFEIKEDNWSSRPHRYHGKPIRIKDTYRKRIREIQ